MFYHENNNTAVDLGLQGFMIASLIDRRNQVRAPNRHPYLLLTLTNNYSIFEKNNLLDTASSANIFILDEQSYKHSKKTLPRASQSEFRASKASTLTLTSLKKEKKILLLLLGSGVSTAVQKMHNKRLA